MYRFARTPRYPWVVLAIAVAGQASIASISNGLPVLYPFIQNEFGLSRAQVGLITSAMLGSGIVTALLGGWLSDLAGVRRVMAIALFAVAALSGVFPLVYSLPAIFILVALIGIAEGPVYPTTSRAIMDWLPKRVLGLAMSVKQTGVPLGGALAAAVLPTLALAIGWRASAALLGPLLLFTAILFLSLYRDAPREAAVVSPKGLAAFRAFRHNRSLVVASIWAFVFVGLQFIVLSYFVLFLVDELQASPVMAGGLLATAHVSSIAARILWGAASDFAFGGRRTIVLVIVGLMGAGGLTGVSLLSADAPMSVVFLLTVAIGVSVLSWHGVFTVAIGEMADPTQVGTMVGVASSVMRIGMISMPPLFGLLADVSGSYSIGWIMAACLALVSTVAFAMLARRSNHHT